jgi:hypothetical protein
MEIPTTMIKHTLLDVQMMMMMLGGKPAALLHEHAREGPVLKGRIEFLLHTASPKSRSQPAYDTGRARTYVVPGVLNCAPCAATLTLTLFLALVSEFG